MNKKIVIVGKGFLGTEVEKEAKKQGYTVTCTNKTKNIGSEKLDIINRKEVDSFISKHHPQFVINCAASGKIDFLEEHQDEAFNVNALGIKNLSLVCKKRGIRIIHISTDSVFDGQNGNYTETDRPNPVNVYAKSKLLGEEELKKNVEDFVLIRTNFYGIDQRGNYFLNWILDSLKNNKEIKGFKDVVFSPVDVQTLSVIIIELLTKKYSGILHISSGVPISKFEFIAKILKVLGENPKKNTPINYNNLFFKSKRPKNTSLDNKKSLGIINTPIISIEQWLENNKKQLLNYIKNSN